MAPTVNELDPERLPEVAVIIVVPKALAVASPFEPETLLMVAIAVLDELQVTVDVTFRTELSEKVPDALNCKVLPGTTLVVAGVTVMEISVGDVDVPPPPPHPASV